jgi:hypothetical protein
MIKSIENLATGKFHDRSDEGFDSGSTPAISYAAATAGQDITKGESLSNMVGLSALIYSNGTLTNSGTLPSIGQKPIGRNISPK